MASRAPWLSEVFLSWIKGQSSLPLLVRLTDGTAVQLDRLQNDQVLPACHLLQEIAKGAVGIGQDEFDSTPKVKAMIHRYMHQNYIFQAVDASTGDLAGLTYVPPSPYVRSLSPITHGGYSVVAPTYQGRGTSSHVFGFIMAAGIKHGYAAMNNRISVKNTKSIVLTLRQGFSIVACIPQSVHLPGSVWAEDLVSHADYRAFGTVTSLAGEEAIIKRAMKPTKLFRKESFTKSQEVREQLTIGCKNAILRSFKEKDNHAIFQILNTAAQQGDGFALDEFPSAELFQSHFLNGRELFILEEGSNIIGVAVTGSAILCRSVNSPCSILYLYIRPNYRNSGYASALLKFLETMLKGQGYNSMITDIFMTRDFPHTFLRNYEFIPSGFIPISGYIKDQGFTDCALYHKYF